MPHVLILGATGTLGSALCTQLLNAGHTVYGLARSPSKASSLLQSEILPVLGSVESPQSILDTLQSHPEISVVVDAAAVYGESVTLLHLIKSAGEARIQHFNKAGVPAGVAPRLGYVYVSGMWVHGSSRTLYASDANPLTGDVDPALPQPVTMVGWRPEIERLVLSDEVRAVLDTAVVRPACLYGNVSAIWTAPLSALHAAAKAGHPVAKLSLDPAGTVAVVHVADAAAGISCVIEKLPLLGKSSGIYPVFDVVGSIESLRAIMDGAAAALGFGGKVELVGAPEGDVLGDALGASTVGDSSRLKSILGWEGPKRKGFLQGVGVYALAWKAGFEARQR